jgi:hypothetical protein
MAKRIWNRTPFCVDLVQCKACGFTFYNPRLDDTELQIHYSGYRSKEYLEMRHSFEPWYTAQFNESLASIGHYSARRAKLAQILRQHLGQRKLSRILDYGGDRGDLVVGLIEGAQSFVYDISGIPATHGVTAISDPAGCNADLIINSNVLEHVGLPRELVIRILGAAPQGGLVYLDVPSEMPLSLKRIFRRIAQIGIMAAAQPGIAGHIARPASLYMMHEHINYFTEHCLADLMRVCGGSIIASGKYPLAATAGNENIAWCLASKG